MGVYRYCFGKGSYYTQEIIALAESIEEATIKIKDYLKNEYGKQYEFNEAMLSKEEKEVFETYGVDG